jgi:hypothetical protein
VDALPACRRQPGRRRIIPAIGQLADAITPADAHDQHHADADLRPGGHDDDHNR